MSYLALYRKYRPSKFSEVSGQKYAVEILKNSIKNNNISHAYLFSGPRGTGKTSIAKIFARAVNCSNPIDGEMCNECNTCKAIIENEIDIIEIDAASNNGVDEIREIRNNVKLLPTIGKYKIYIIDEVHMLSTGAFNALLKTLEEPPQHVIFILATTEIQKIPLTIISRCQKFDFKRLTNQEIISKLKEILVSENRNVPDDVLNLIAEVSDGGMRDAINSLDQVLSMHNENVTIDDIYNLTGDVSKQELEQMFDIIINCDIPTALNKINEYYNQGKNIYSIIERLIVLVRNININNNVKDYFDAEYTSYIEKYNGLSNEITNYIANKLMDLSNNIRKTSNQKLLFEINILEIIEYINLKGNQKAIERSKITEEQEEKADDKILTGNDEIISREIISIRINNTFAGATKEKLIENKSKLDHMSEYLSNEHYNKLVNILRECSLVASSSEYLLFSTEKDSKLNLFYFNLEKIEKFIAELIGNKYKIVAVKLEEWNKIKKEYINNIQNGIKYILQDEPKKQKTGTNKKIETVAEKIFGEENIDIK